MWGRQSAVLIRSGSLGIVALERMIFASVTAKLGTQRWEDKAERMLVHGRFL